MNALGALLGSHSHAGRHVIGSDFMPGASRGNAGRLQAHENDIADTQQMLSEKLSQRLAEKLPAAESATTAASSATTAATTSATKGSSEDFSPATVADRIIGFIEQRLAQEKANGASDEALQQRLQQGLEGVRQGMQEAREELEGRGMFAGKVRDDYFETFGRVQQGLDDLQKKLAGPAADTTTATSGNGGQQTPVVTASGSQWDTSGVAVSASRDFAMEVTTRDGDVVKINVSSARSFAAAMTSFKSDGADASGFAAQISGEDNFSFSVDGNLDEGEMKALSDLFSQVNDVAGTFYGGDVEAAFQQALSVGYDQNELAGFAANMTQTQTVVATQAYEGVARAGGGEAGQGQGNLLAPLVDFARHVRNAEHALTSANESLLNGKDLFRQLLGQLPNDDAAVAESAAAATASATDSKSATAAEDDSTQASPWQQFVDGVVTA